jgi:ribonuclease G
MKQRVYLEENADSVKVAIVENDRLEHYYKLDNKLLTGSIVLGKVIKIIKQLGIFIDIGREKNALLRSNESLRIGDMVIVQILREEEGDKGCAVTERLTLAGRYLVLNDLKSTHFSRKISDARKAELRDLSTKNQDVGFVFRSACQYADNDSIIAEANKLADVYADIIQKGKNNMRIQFLYEEKGIEVAKRFALSDDVISYSFDEIREEIEQINNRKIEIEGVEIVFDKTEAMTVVDVNSHKYNCKYKDMDNTHFQANVLAVKEIARQLRLRNIGGIIMVDFISLNSNELKKNLLEELQKELLKDNVMVKAELIESLSLLAIVRKKRYTEN